MSRVRLKIDPELHRRAKELDLDLSKLLEYAIKRVLEALETSDFKNAGKEGTPQADPAAWRVGGGTSNRSA